MQKKLMLGNEAVARGVYEAGATVASSYPGTPSTEITEYISKYDEIYSEWAVNEKVSVEVAIGASIAGARAFSAMKHVGLNVAADPLFTSSYIGVNGGLVIAVADDQGMHSSQNEQDSRHYARAAKVLMLEPSDSDECLKFTKLAFDLSERYDTPVFLRLSTRISHSQSIVELGERLELEPKQYVKNVQKNVMMPAMARIRHTFVEERTKKLIDYAETSRVNKVEINDTKIGIITSGAAYQYAKEALPQASFLKLGITFPLPSWLIKNFAAQVEKLYVIEELDDIIEQHCKTLGLNVIGKDIFPICGEISSAMIKKAILGEQAEFIKLEEQVPMRPPVLCPACPHRGVFYTLKKLKLIVSGDIGCYTLGALSPLEAMDVCVCMGASVSALHGMVKAKDLDKKAVAVIGDSTFVHSGITGLIDMVYNKSTATVLILDNSITGMTGHQDNPTTGQDIKGQPAPLLDLVKLSEAVGVKRVTVCNPFELGNLEEILKRETQCGELSVIIVKSPCALLKSRAPQIPYEISEEKCTGCKMCMKLGCPSISMVGKKATIDKTLCLGCNLCSQVCKFNAISNIGGATV